MTDVSKVLRWAARHAAPHTAVLVIASTLLLAGCGSRAAAPPASPTPKPVITPVPQILAAYADNTSPTITHSVKVARYLLSQMQNKSPTDVSGSCNSTASRLSNLRAIWVNTWFPYQAASIRKTIGNGFKYSLGAAQECGLASDQNSSSAMQTAISDMRAGIRDLSSAQATELHWQAAKTS
jgi:hypothetical protein